jgi:hypothetical protein
MIVRITILILALLIPAQKLEASTEFALEKAETTEVILTTTQQAELLKHSPRAACLISTHFDHTPYRVEPVYKPSCVLPKSGRIILHRRILI